MPKTSKFLDSAVVSTAKKELAKLGPYGYVSKKLLAVIAASRYGIGEVAKIYNVNRNTITEWIKHIKDLNLEKLRAPEERCKPHKLNKERMLEVKSWVASDPCITSRALMIRIKEFYDIDVSITTAYRIIKRLNYSYITPRPTHYKQNKDRVEEFKKKSDRANTK